MHFAKPFLTQKVQVMDGIFPLLKQLQNNGLLKTKPDIGLELPVLAE